MYSDILSYMKTVLGIDCSSTTIGLCVLKIDDNNNIIYDSLSYIKPKKDGNLIERLASTRDKLKDFIENHRKYLN